MSHASEMSKLSSLNKTPFKRKRGRPRKGEMKGKGADSEFDLQAFDVKCTSCGQYINHYSNCRRHQKLNVITCKECYDFYEGSEFSHDNVGHKYCMWCGMTGKLIRCDYCHQGFCNSCIRRNFDDREIFAIKRDYWKCYCCDKRRLRSKVRLCDLIMNCGENVIEKKKKMQTNMNKNIYEDCLQAAFNESHEACKNFHKKTSKLKAMGANKSGSLKHMVKKMEIIINTHRIELKNVVASMFEKYEAYMEMQVQLNEKKTDSDSIVHDKDTTKTLSGRILSDASVPISSKQPNVKNSDNASSPSVNPIDDRKSKVKAKCKLYFNLSDSSDNDSNVGKIYMDELLEEMEDEDKMTNKKEDRLSKSKETNKELDAQLDPKHKREPRVCIIRCDPLFKDCETCIKISNNTDGEDGQNPFNSKKGLDEDEEKEPSKKSKNDNSSDDFVENKEKKGSRKRHLLSYNEDKTEDEGSEKSYSSTTSSDEEKSEKQKQHKKCRRIKEID